MLDIINMKAHRRGGGTRRPDGHQLTKTLAAHSIPLRPSADTIDMAEDRERFDKLLGAPASSVPRATIMTGKALNAPGTWATPC
ncbi:MAG: hypothetical protein ACLRSY_05635 [Acutalibacter sp.]